MTIDYETVAKLKKLPVKKIIINPIPLHPKREKERGFNQAEIIALFIQKLIDKPFGHYFTRVRPTLPQAQITKKKERTKNMGGAFLLTKATNNQNFMLIDDILTTGATLKEAASVLKKGGAAGVYAFTLAKG